MLMFQVLRGLVELVLGQQAQAQLGIVGVLVLLLVGIGIRARRGGLAVGAVVVFVVLMTQA
ncbi:hypothetical protein [Streptomyces fulvoviolaceus]|uniref:hypothetical protein n=1 Tax=Streptomyces fulvoviolaceus TaxID=285535 RepID=UPI0004C9156F|nr:hypothetical protein [Streptomyces fulvoviolaceus]MCT9077109.1 hypothetical protein [Streptomyces fulvoviolaceus]